MIVIGVTEELRMLQLSNVIDEMNPFVVPLILETSVTVFSVPAAPYGEITAFPQSAIIPFMSVSSVRQLRTVTLLGRTVTGEPIENRVMEGIVVLLQQLLQLSQNVIFETVGCGNPCAI